MKKLKLYKEHRWLYLKDRVGAVRKMRVVGEHGGAWLIGFHDCWETYPQSEYVSVSQREWEDYETERVDQAMRLPIIALVSDRTKTDLRQLGKVADALGLRWP